MLNYIAKLNPCVFKKIWGSELWVVSTHSSGSSIIANGELKGKRLSELYDLPVLIKIIETSQTLSVQVHPGDDYAKKHEGEMGKTECWYIIDSDSEVELIVGLENVESHDSMETVLRQSGIESHLNRIKITEGDFIDIPPGTVHAITSGIKLLEIQQSSDVTYRIYDWMRDRKLHISEALDVIDYTVNPDDLLTKDFKEFSNDYYKVEKIEFDTVFPNITHVNSEMICIYTIINGEFEFVQIESKESGILVKASQDETIFIPRGLEHRITGRGVLIRTTFRE